MTVSGCCGGHVVEVAGKRPIGPSKPARLGTLGRSKSRASEGEGVGEADRAGAIEATPAARGIDGVRRTGDVLRRTTASPGPFSDCRQDGGKGSVEGCLKQDARAKYSNNSSGAPKPKGSCVSKNGAARKGKKLRWTLERPSPSRAAAGSHSYSVHIHIHTPPSSRPPVKTMQPAEGPETLALWDGHFWTVPARDIEPGTRWRELLQGKWQWRVGV